MDSEEKYKHEFYMRQCIDLALIAKRRGESPVGAIVVRNEKVIAEAMEAAKTHQDITYHAEIVAVRQATAFLHSQDLSNCVLYTTHEPCIMCSYMIRHTRISEVVVGRTSGEIGGISSAYPLLLDASIERWGEPPKIVSGILHKECLAL